MSPDLDAVSTWDKTAEVDIETSRGEGAPVHRTTIWIVVDGDTAYIRSVRGPKGRWYREIVANPKGAIYVGERRTPVVASAANDEASIARVSALLTQKYGKRWPESTDAMLRAETLETTLRLAL